MREGRPRQRAFPICVRRSQGREVPRIEVVEGGRRIPEMLREDRIRRPMSAAERG